VAESREGIPIKDNHAFAAVFLYLAGALLVLIALNLAVGLTSPRHTNRFRLDPFLEILGRVDGASYEQILLNGYTYSRERCTTAVFFPGYPFVARSLYDCGMPARWALLTTSWSSLLGALWLAQRYLSERIPQDREAANLALAALALNPMTFYMWFMYSEATFLLLLVLLLALMQRRAPPVVVALVCGALTGVRSAGVAAIPVVLIYAWVHRPAPGLRLVNVGLASAICAWGLTLFAWQMHVDFGDALAFVHAQEPYGRVPNLAEKLQSLATLGPLRRMFNPEAFGYWDKTHNSSLAVFNNQVGDALFWSLFTVLIGVGAWKRWLNWQELLLSGLLLAFATWFQADRNDMASQGRYMSVIFPAYITAGRLLAGVGWEMRLTIAAVAAGLYVNYTVNFSVGNAW